MHVGALFIAMLCCTAVPPISTTAQNRGVTKLYRDQFVQLHERTTAMLDRAEQLVKNGASDQTRLELQEETLALTKLVQRLSEESMRTYVDDEKRNGKPDKDLRGI